ncbi:CRISPR-associated protein Cas4 [Sulfobacillus sp. hq2]|uniref:CRISPR-associated protein Cas4 n=1 Tax=Sulfobacillus TaxID=28033 RepID=UPI000CCFD845|nr:CRISPR-associated protein Cas4 [Sulfobacillus sp. hq2]POB09410.1 CRISPR-associated protein Cas4 [Sulfobacillus sp. hq2]
MKTLVTISSLNQYAYCPRRCALIYQEQIFEDNLYTTEGTDLHQHVDEVGSHAESVPVETSLRLWSKKLGLTGIADVVEWHDHVPYPVEYKRGKRHKWINDDLQLCAQALCLEEMLGMAVPRGAIYHAKSRRRREVIVTEALREQTRRTVETIRQLILARHLPPPTERRERCVGCSLEDQCMPTLYGSTTMLLEDMLKEDHDR